MPTIRQAIDEFCGLRLQEYQADPDRAVRDARSAQESATDHLDRWPLELIQNSEDACAKKVSIQVTSEAIYFSDNGHGLKPEAIKSLSGTHLSIKEAGSIGRKGLGFKAVFGVSDSPQVFSHESGLVFDRGRAHEWLAQNKVDLASHNVPYQWLPFYLARSVETAVDPILRSLAEYVTVVRLPMKSKEHLADAVELLRSFPANVLLTFTKIESLSVELEDGAFTVRVQRPSAGSGIAILSDSRSGEKPVRWRVRRGVARPPDEVLGTIEDEDDRRRVREASLLVAAPIGENDVVTSAMNDPALYVYYPTEEPSPVPLLLHGDFFVKSDRTRILPLDKHPYNDWLAQHLARLVIEFVNGSYTRLDPAANLRLLRLRKDVASHPTSESLWKRIWQQAREHLLVADSSGYPYSSTAEGYAHQHKRRSDQSAGDPACRGGCLIVRARGA